MPKQSTTTNPSSERNSPREIVFDMETDISELEAHAAELQAYSRTWSPRLEGALYDLADTIAEHVDALRVAHRRLHAAVPRPGGSSQPAEAKPDRQPPSADCPPRSREWEQFKTEWDRLYAEWLGIQRQWAELEADDDATDEDGEKIMDAEAALIVRMVRARPPLAWQIGQKVNVLEMYMNQMGDWSDRRDEVLLASIKRDLEALS